MERRAFLRGLLLAPVAVPVAAKAMADVPGKVSVTCGQVTAESIRVDSPARGTWHVMVDENGYVTGFRGNPVPVFTVANIDGDPRIAVRADLISDLNEIAAKQNAALA